MKCDEFCRQLDSLPHPALPQDLLQHAQACPACRRQHSLQQRFFKGVHVLKQIPQAPDLSAKILGKLGNIGPEQPPFWKKFLDLFLPDGAVQSTLVYGGALVLILALGSLVLYRSGYLARHSELRPRGVVGWQLSQNTAQTVTGTELEPGDPRFVVEGTITHGTIGEIRLSQARVTPVETGIRLQEGTAACYIKPSGRAFRVWTPFAEVLVLGTRFHLEVTREFLSVAVDSGKVQVQAQNAQQILTSGQSCKVGPEGFLPNQAATIPPVRPQPTVSPDIDPNLTNQPNE